MNGTRTIDMACGACGRPFKLEEQSYTAAERKKCPHCGSKETTPIIVQKVKR